MTLDQAPTGRLVVVSAGPTDPGPAAAAPEAAPASTTRPGGRQPQHRLPSRAVARRLAELGFRAGTTLSILSRTSGGGAIVAIGDDRIAVSREILRAIPVTPARQGVSSDG